MTYIELMVVLLISVIIFSISIISVFRMLDKMILNEELFKTIVYCGLWKSNADYIKYKGNKVYIYYTFFRKENVGIIKEIDFGNYFESNELRIIPLYRVTGGTFGKYKVEPIVFDISGE
ncbi:hypothetical protein SU69_08835 [Thermosipho melanesiensis]|uniref:Uncharacterized protein n=2 Tax=Thermosipho melanesiensis TaxID=46541 RepID=A6LNT6_THEM4|nr:hypothetical protein [Thermosipho melanesiensis]ABR31587.1 hypothetical protein Tmel_1748 [Thermosipho melanesiensis BI429]APT74618.1 hypothetical protein BW47_09210 [Thermosipho melanesiensis]OOC35323.1 hypothetical protein SU69_08835 [Thermosipho melanesiensis]OOC35541.1 hypothetical protein SU70_08845 [Thermosipho melanesiensis]OOC36578.1 hypothetical protein SU68_08900 [Thermosipho melanesiensis]